MLNSDITDISEELFSRHVPATDIAYIIDIAKRLEAFIADFVDLHGRYNVNCEGSSTYDKFKVGKFICLLTIYDYGEYILTCQSDRLNVTLVATLKLIPNDGWRWELK